MLLLDVVLVKNHRSEVVEPMFFELGAVIAAGFKKGINVVSGWENDMLDGEKG